MNNTIIPNFKVSSTDTDSVALQIDSNNTPYILYQDSTAQNRATVRKYNGVNWTTVGNPGFSAGAIAYASIAIDSHNTPYVVYQDAGNSLIATCMKYTGTSWVTVGNPGFSIDVVSYTSLTFDATKKTYAVYHTCL